MQELLNLYRVAENSNWLDKDITKAFDRALNRANVVELIKELIAHTTQPDFLSAIEEQLKEAADDIANSQDYAAMVRIQGILLGIRLKKAASQQQGDI